VLPIRGNEERHNSGKKIRAIVWACFCPEVPPTPSQQSACSAPGSAVTDDSPSAPTLQGFCPARRGRQARDDLSQQVSCSIRDSEKTEDVQRGKCACLSLTLSTESDFYSFTSK
jgi:hypothetical protein